MLQRFFGHVLTSCKSNYRLILLIAGTYTLMSTIEDEYSVMGTLVEFGCLLVAVILSFMLAIQSHYTTLKTERADIVAGELTNSNKGRFIKVAILVNLVAYIPMVSIAAMFIFGIESKLDLMFDTSGDFLLLPWLSIGGLTLLTIALYVALGPFIPRTLSNLHKPFKQQVGVNLSNWKRALFYLLCCAVLTAFIFAGIAKTALIYVMGNHFFFEVLGAGIHAVLISALSILSEIVDAVSIVLFATAFSMHFLDTIAAGYDSNVK
jgi:hypothetical protein